MFAGRWRWVIRTVVGMALVGVCLSLGVDTTSIEMNAVSGDPPWQVIGLGDSVTSGYGCGCRDFVAGYAQLTSVIAHHAVTALNRGSAGQTSDGLQKLLESDPATRSAVAGADIVLVTIGANDFDSDLAAWEAATCDIDCFLRDVPGMRDRIAAIVADIQRLSAPRAAQVMVTTYWNVFLDGEQGRLKGAAYQAMAGAVTRQVDQAICAATQTQGGWCVDLVPTFKGVSGTDDPTPLLQADGDHPNAAGHEAIAEALAAERAVTATLPHG